MWAPGACSSKPTFLLQGKYIFIDDGKTNPEDKYNSYVIFDMQKGTYNYIGGSNFSSDQGDKETILKAVNENDKLVFYIDPADTANPQPSQYGGFTHTKGNDHGYVIRREIDPATMHYTDYSLPFTLPSDVTTYRVNSYSLFDSVISINKDTAATDTFYSGKVSNNRLELTLHHTQDTYNVNDTVVYDSPLELSLGDKIKAQLPAFGGQTPYADSKYKTDFIISELGSHNTLQFLTIKQRYDNFDTPAIYNTQSGDFQTLTDQAVISQPSQYVELGVF